MDKNSLTRKITMLAMLLALGTVLKLLEINPAGNFRIAFFEIPLIIAGIIGGPIYGFFVALIADGLYIFLKGWPYSPLMAISTCIWGLWAFLLVRKGKMKLSALIIFVIVLSIVSFIINSIQLHLWGRDFETIIRVVVMIVKIPLLIGAVWLVYDRVLPAFSLPDKNTFTE